MTTPSIPVTSASLQADRELVQRELRIGRISYLNMEPMQWALGVEPALSGVPTKLNQALLAGEIDVACISSIEYARHADELVVLPSLCIAADGAVTSIYVISNGAFDEIEHLHVTSASASSVALSLVLQRLRGRHPNLTQLEGSLESGAVAKLLETPGTGVLLIGNEALRSRGVLGGSHVFTDLGERWKAETGQPMVYAVWAVRRDAAARAPEAVAALDALLVDALARFDDGEDGVAAAADAHDMPMHTARMYFDRLTYDFGPDERTGLVRFWRAASEYGLLDRVPTVEFAAVSADAEVALAADALASGAPLSGAGGNGHAAESDRDRAAAAYVSWVGTRAALSPRPEDEEQIVRCLDIEADARAVDVDGVLHKALSNERISEVEGVALLQSGRLVDVGHVAHELRMRRADPDSVTFIIDRNINYTNVCITNCGFCAFFRRPGDESDAYLQTTDEILERIRETVELGGTAALMQGGHNPDLRIEWYIDLFQAIKREYPTFHLHALSPPEIQHIARRSKLSTAEVLSTLRDAGLDSLPGGGGEVLVDRVRRILAPKKTKAGEWLGIMAEAQRAGMSTTATLMYGHVEMLSERVEHMRRVRDLQDETGGFRAFISWTFQEGTTPLAKLLQVGGVPHQDRLPPKPTPLDYLLTQAVSRIFLDNVSNIQSSWVTQGMKVGQAALMYGANDMGSIMIEENVVSSAGTTFRASTEDFVHAISALGLRAVQRDTLYRTVAEHAR